MSENQFPEPSSDQNKTTTPTEQPYPGTPQNSDYPQQPVQPQYAGQQYPQQQYPGQQYAGQPYTGRPYAGQPYAGAGEQKSKIAAGILGILLGSLGIHNFYLGFTKKALIQLLVSVISLGFLSPFMAIWGIIEGIFILIGRDGFRADANGVPLKD